MSNAESDFLEGLRAVREAGLPAKANDVAVVAAYRVFIRDETSGRQLGPLYAKQLVLEAYSNGK